MSGTRYDAGTRGLHWLSALLVIATYALALYRDEIPKGDFRNLVTMVHISLGFSVFALLAVRIFWRFTHPAPAPVPMSALMHTAAKAGHGLLYLSLLAVPLIGLLMVWAKGRTPMIFGVLALPPMIGPDKGLAKTLEEAHEVMGHLMMLLAFGHAAASIYHQKVLKDGTLGRMLSFLPSTPETSR